MKITDALQRAGLRRLTPKQYLRKMEKLGEPATKFLDAADAGFHPAAMKTAYDLQHADAKVSKLVSSISYFDLYSSFLEWITRNLDEPDCFLDLGCSNGLFSLAVGQIWEEAAGVGIDKNEQAIRTALKLRDSVDQGDSIDFFPVDFSEPLSDNLKLRIGAPNVVFAGFFFHELIHDEQALMRALTNLASILPESGLLVSVDRFPETELQRTELISLMRRVGVTTKQKELLVVGEERFPLTVFVRKEAI